MSDEMEAADYLRLLKTGRARVATSVNPARGRQESKGEDILAEQIRQIGLPAPQPQFYWDKPDSKCRADLAWLDPKYSLLLEVQGGGEDGAHQNFLGYEADCERMARALIKGWVMMYVTTAQVKSGQAVTWVECFLIAADLRHSRER